LHVGKCAKAGRNYLSVFPFRDTFVEHRHETDCYLAGSHDGIMSVS
jgi:hypothetical protein